MVSLFYPVGRVGGGGASIVVRLRRRRKWLSIVPFALLLEGRDIGIALEPMLSPYALHRRVSEMGLTGLSSDKWGQWLEQRRVAAAAAAARV